MTLPRTAHRVGAAMITREGGWALRSAGLTVCPLPALPALPARQLDALPDAGALPLGRLPTHHTQCLRIGHFLERRSASYLG
ncbi:hypothetical protein H340_27950 [Streptomyces mobaraensis NBRC 13819 = DSM 40847]|uniref:Uncharacterized protein n=1 Tax=Streptomyces mobaraensis (strain ATCC 29032 / DSM 40847 / JCM 4168 / NBRC 13819 / NCIMB 11159 / IPCR 16-22) TaxID=1223523 RepID=M3BZM3_STRM1|nr:hypothetical protein H340_27950 [Streptomyces mobaraensis NBRC 13819 = DSM 40847]